jgi:anti-sigma factor RsiW
MTVRGTHPAVEQLVAWLDGELPFLRRSRVDRHVRECRECRDRVAGLEATVGAVRQSILRDESQDKVEIARARWRFREAVRELEPQSSPSRRTALLATLAVAAGVLVAVWFANPRQQPPRTNEPASLARVQWAENAGYASAIREERFQAEIAAPGRLPARREVRIWSAPQRKEFAARVSDLSGSVQFAVYASADRPEMVYSPGKGLATVSNPGKRIPLLRAVENAGDLKTLESAFWTWVRHQVWEPVSLARETAEFASLEGVRLTVERRGATIVWRAERGDAQSTTMLLEVGPDGLPRSMDLWWGKAEQRRTIRISRLGRLNYPDFHTAAAHFRPDAPVRTPILPPVTAELPAPSALVPVEEQPPDPVALRAAEVQAFGLLHRLRLCVSDEVRVARGERAVEVSGIVVNEDRRSQLLLLFGGLPTGRLLRLDLRIAPDTAAARLSEAASFRSRKTEPAPGEKWLRERLHVGDAATHREVLDAMNRLVQGALAISADGWALRLLAEHFPEGLERDLPEQERRLLRSMAEDHAIAVQAQISSVTGALGYPAAGLTGAAESVATPWQSVATRLQVSAEKSSATLLRFFAAGGADVAPADFTPADAMALDRDLHVLAGSAGSLRSDIRTAASTQK